MKSTVAYILTVFGVAIILSAISALVVGAIGMWLWNWLAVSLLEMKPTDYWTAVGICFALAFLRNLIFPKTTIKVKD